MLGLATIRRCSHTGKPAPESRIPWSVMDKTKVGMVSCMKLLCNECLVLSNKFDCVLYE